MIDYFKTCSQTFLGTDFAFAKIIIIIRLFVRTTFQVYCYLTHQSFVRSICEYYCTIFYTHLAPTVQLCAKWTKTKRKETSQFFQITKQNYKMCGSIKAFVQF